MPAISVGWDWFSILLKNSIVIGGLNSTFILANAAERDAVLVLPDPRGPGRQRVGLGPIVDIVQTNVNLFKVKVKART